MQTLGVLAHLQGGDGHAAGIDGLGGRDNHAGLLHEIEQRLVGGGHIGHFDVILEAVGHHLLRPGHRHIVLGCAGHHHVGLDAPRLLAGEELAAELVGVVLHLVAAGGAHLHHVVKLLLGVDAVGIVDIAVGAGEGDDLGAQLRGLAADCPGHVAKARDGDGLAGDGVVLVVQDLGEVVHGAEARGLGTDQGAAVGLALAGEDAVFKGALQAAVLAEQVADFPAAHADVAGGHVDIGADVAVEGIHKALAEAHDLGVGLAAGVKVAAALAAADGKAGEGVLEDLLKAQELDDAGVDRGMEAKTALVGAKGTVELEAITGIGVVVTFVVHPAHAEGELTLGLHHAIEQIQLFILGMGVDQGLHAGENLFHSLDELGLILVFLLDVFDHTVQVCVHFGCLLAVSSSW